MNKPAPTAMRRFDKHVKIGNPKVLKIGHPATTQARTLYPSTVHSPDEVKRCLKSGQNHFKIGAVCTKSRWKGMPIFTLTLEERATCPSFCAQWRTCYGNKMHRAERLLPGPYLEAHLERELTALQKAHPNGFVVRLHVLGDFYSLAYAVRWSEWLNAFPALHVFGYSAWPKHSRIGAFLLTTSQLRWDRFAVRLSGSSLEHHGAEVVSVRIAKHIPQLLVCPAETGRTDCCGTCGLCWQTTKTITFLEH